MSNTPTPGTTAAARSGGGTRPRSLVTALIDRATGPVADLPVFTALGSAGERVARLTAAELDCRVREVAAALRAVGGAGDRVIVPDLPGLDFHVGFLGCLYAGMIAVPVPALPRDPHRDGLLRAERLAAVRRDCSPRAVLTATPEEAAGPDPLPGVARVAVRRPSADPGGPAAADAAFPDPSALRSETTALLQYASDDTRDPRGVAVSHGSLAAGGAALGERCDTDAGTTVVSWLPLSHGTGLATSLVLPLMTGAAAVVMKPATFVRDPRVWLRAIEAEDDVFAAAPDFAYDLCVTRTTQAERDAIDLATWRVAANDAEPLRPATLRRFATAFRTCLFREEVFTPGYGLAGGTLGVTMGRPLYETPAGRYDRAALTEGKAVPAAAPEGAVELVGSGAALTGTQLRIVDPGTRRVLGERTVGEIWVAAPGVSAGRWGTDERSAGDFEARTVGDDSLPDGGYVRTGDSGFLDDGELYVLPALAR
ncbi:AMP-binding protein [Streptomyces sp. NPDC042319]|uniref:AMP-binding protein n=1 Tax=Streptomyces sp. NPDC042319 TaxID=3154332 RepID=UPI0033C447DB